MNRKQLQLEVCKALLDKSRRLYGAEINEREFAVTTTGYDAFVFDKTECIFNPDLIGRLDSLSGIFKEHDDDVIITETGKMFFDSSRTFKEYRQEDLFVYVDVKFANKFKGLNFYAHHPLERILVKDQFGRKIGVFLPVKFTGIKELKV